jgi:trimethylamine:corrinoid methyltransferase-like protein
MTRSAYAKWREEGAKDMAQRVQEKIEDILANHEVPALADKTIDALKTIRKKGEKELVKG